MRSSLWLLPGDTLLPLPHISQNIKPRPNHQVRSVNRLQEESDINGDGCRCWGCGRVVVFERERACSGGVTCYAGLQGQYIYRWRKRGATGMYQPRKRAFEPGGKLERSLRNALFAGTSGFMVLCCGNWGALLDYGAVGVTGVAGSDAIIHLHISWRAHSPHGCSS